jgi:ATP-dependent helicase HrpB
LVEAILAKWDSLLTRTEEGAQTEARLRFAARAVPELALPALDSEFRRTVANRLAEGETRLSAVESKNWSEALLADLSWEAQTALDREVPARFLAPSGSRVAIHYPEGQAPYVEIRIQEVFGLAATPAIGRGRIPLQLRLLAPNYRPFQVTQDLASFWRNGYTEARKELRARYPKHAWPEDPIAAAPQAKGRPTRSR